jgi:hypothetical protein
VDLDDRDLGAALVDVLVERDQPWLVRLDEIDEAGTLALSSSSFPGLSRLVAMKMNGPDMERLLMIGWWFPRRRSSAPRLG